MNNSSYSEFECPCKPGEANEQCYWFGKEYFNPYHAAVERVRAYRERMRQLPDGETDPTGILQNLSEASVEPLRNEGEQEQTEWLEM